MTFIPHSLKIEVASRHFGCGSEQCRRSPSAISFSPPISVSFRRAEKAPNWLRRRRRRIFPREMMAGSFSPRETERTDRYSEIEKLSSVRGFSSYLPSFSYLRKCLLSEYETEKSSFLVSATESRLCNVSME